MLTSGVIEYFNTINVYKHTLLIGTFVFTWSVYKLVRARRESKK